MKKLCFIFLLLPALSFAQGKTFLDFNNERAPIFPGCEGVENVLECYILKIGGIVCNAVNARPINGADELLIEIRIMTHPTGESVVQKIKAPNPEIESISTEALKNLPLVTPPVSHSENPGSVSEGFFVRLRKKAGSSKYEVVINGSTEKWKKEPHPFAGAMTPALFPGCESRADDKNCNANQFREWLMKEIEGKIKSGVQETVMVRLHFNDTGRLEKYEFKTQSSDLRKTLEAALKKFPRITPATMSGKKIGTTYAIPVYFDLKP